VEITPPVLSHTPLAYAPLPYAYARKHGAVLQDGDDGVHVLLREGADPAVLLTLRQHVGQGFAGVETLTGEAFDTMLSERYALDSQAAVAGAVAVGEDSLDMLASDLPTAEDLLDSADDAPAIRLINGIIADAARQGVSDIHVEPYENALIVRMRKDGVLTEALRMPPHTAPVLVSRIKVMARLDIAERRIPQDGRIALNLAGRMIDARVSTLPGRAGERVVMRLLDKENAGISFDQLGLSGQADSVLRAALAEPNGIILVTGPTGSGKTTTLYAALTQLNDGSRNILTVEDPVEYAVDGVGQTQVNPKVGLTFAAGLRAILRQDPDVVLVGEIRDRETADIAVQASLTGHLVLSTVHTNDAIGAITRLRDMKVEPFLIASSLRAVLAQRLVRRLCPVCREAAPAGNGLAPAIGIAPSTTVWHAKGCPECKGSGFKGRVGVYEAIKIDDTLRRMINDGGDEARMSAHAFANTPTLADNARTLVLNGVTTIEEAIRIARHEGAADSDAPATQPSGQSDG
jgi:general secretion pathway protein E